MKGGQHFHVQRHFFLGNLGPCSRYGSRLLRWCLFIPRGTLTTLAKTGSFVCLAVLLPSESKVGNSKCEMTRQMRGFNEQVRNAGHAEKKRASLLSRNSRLSVTATTSDCAKNPETMVPRCASVPKDRVNTKLSLL